MRRALLTPSVMGWQALQAELHRHNMFNADHQEALDANAAMDTIDALIVSSLDRGPAIVHLQGLPPDPDPEPEDLYEE